MLIISRLIEDMEHFRSIGGLNHVFKRISIRMFDLKKAFPSTDWRSLTKVMELLGFTKASRFWSALEALHRSPIYLAGKRKFGLSMGVKEGDTSSPTVFIVYYSAVIRAFCNFRESKGLSLGVRLHSSGDDGSNDRTRDMKDLLFGGANDTSVEWLTELLFADDTTLIDDQSDAEVSEVTVAYRYFIKLLGAFENEGKFLQGDVTEVNYKNLGIKLDPDEDINYKRDKGWKSYNSFKKKISALPGVSQREKGNLFSSIIRSTITYGLEARGMQQDEVNKLKVFDNLLCRLISNYNKITMEKYDVNQSDLRHRLDIPCLETFISYKKASFYGHTLRREGNPLVRRVLTGRFIPEYADSAELNEDEKKFLQFYSKYDFPSDEVPRATIKSNVYKWLYDCCDVPEGCVEELIAWGDGSTFKRIINEGYVRGAILDYRKAKQVDKKFLLQRFKNLCEKYAIELKDPDSIDINSDYLELLNTAKNLFRVKRCFACSSGLEAGNTLKKAKASLKKHFTEKHQRPITETAEKYHKMCLVWKKQKIRELSKVEFTNYRDYFKPVNEFHAAENRVSTYNCLKCKYQFKTHLEAMIAHADDHKEDRYILIGQKDTSRDTEEKRYGNFIPEQHYFNVQSQVYSFAGARRVGFVLPDIAKFRKGYLYCRTCNDRSIPWPSRVECPDARERTNLRIKRLKALREHEEYCKIAVDN